jgi:hypothetical protein
MISRRSGQYRSWRKGGGGWACGLGRSEPLTLNIKILCNLHNPDTIKHKTLESPPRKSVTHFLFDLPFAEDFSPSPNTMNPVDCTLCSKPQDALG